ncbi:hypothetical protein Taro_041650, partial [Colocasia esculenta]|nr:hypothetical protein [Colocasia esculenta]
PTNGKKRPFNITEGPSQERKPKISVPNTLVKSNCKHCDKPDHTVDECWQKVGACLRCGSREHRILECLLLKENERRPNVRPKMTHALTRKGMTKSEAKSTLESLCYLRVVVRPRMTHTLTRKGMTKSEARSTLESLCYLRVV